jgi:histidyl-tRNA synthetase
MSKPSIPRGTRDFLPAEMVRRNYIFDTIRSSFQRYGFLPIETPAMEKTETLMGKYGEEGDRLIFKILNSGDYLKKANEEALAERNSTKLISSISEKALRYDLTVPFARFVVQHQNDIAFPFKRYQIQPVWRADRPQKGRYREFFQCDADMIGSNSLLNEVELVQLIDEVFTNLKVSTTIKVNNRKILTGIAEITGEADKIIDITVAIDKLDKIGPEKVVAELEERGISLSAIEKIKPLFELEGNNDEVITTMNTMLADSEIGLKGVEELKFVFDAVKTLGLSSSVVEFDVTLARGLNYYTGCIFEIKANEGTLTSSICGGGRYDDLTGVFGLPNVSGVGISFGADRIYDVLNELDLYPDFSSVTTKLMFVNFGDEEAAYCMNLLKQVRDAGINAELYPDTSKTRKQMKYANDKGIAYVAMVGSNEMESGVISLKEMATGEQEQVTPEELIARLK